MICSWLWLPLARKNSGTGSQARAYSVYSTSSGGSAALLGNKAYLNGLMQVSERIGHWIELAQKDGSISAACSPLRA